MMGIASLNKQRKGSKAEEETRGVSSRGRREERWRTEALSLGMRWAK